MRTRRIDDSRPPMVRLLLVGSFCFAFSLPGQALNPCDLNQDGVVNQLDVSLAVQMAIGAAACKANVEGPLTCTVITVQRVVNASLGQPCVTYNTHSATLSWTASTSLNIAGYHIYRSTTSGGPYTLVNPQNLISGTTYTDTSVQAGATYFYVATSVDSSGNESVYSNETSGTIPAP